jgi:hypothetical protein
MTNDTEQGKVFSLDKGSSRIIAAIQSGNTTRRYQCILESCENPVCVCGTVLLSFSPLENSDRDDPILSYQVDIDVFQTKLADEGEKKLSKENSEFAKSLVSSMNDADFKLLWKFYYARKNEITEKASPDEIDAVFDFIEVEKEGLMYAYNDVLPYSDHLSVRMEDKEYIIFDQYCLLPKCPCTDTTLTFFTDEPSGKDERQFSIDLNYKKKRWGDVRDHDFVLDAQSAQSAIEEQIPDIWDRLLKRHKKLKEIYGHCKKRHFAQQSQAQLTLPKAGRNDPCPCGSGKKYKKCCLKKENLPGLL